jgi:O-antigen/teichoic acid export membrane protein
MTTGSVRVARGILRNAGALFLVGAFAKGAGLIIAVLVARFLGADAMGLFAVLFSVSVLIETFISFGMSDSLVRDVAAHPAEAPEMFRSALKLVTWISVLPVICLAIAAFLADKHEAARASLLILAIGTPISGAFVVAQAVLQGTERVALLTWVTFIARIASLAVLFLAFHRGSGIAAAFASRVLFHLLSLAVFALVLLRHAGKRGAVHSARHLLTRAVPFAVNKGIRELGLRLPSFVLPGVAGLAAAGTFNAANQLRSTVAMVMSASIVGLMPAFARSLVDSTADANDLVGYSVKYMCLGMSLAATVVALLSGWIIDLLYGAEFAAAARLLQILIWAQVVTAVDAVLQQAMLARGEVYPTIRHSTAGVAAQFALILTGAAAIGLEGAAVAVLLSMLLTLGLNLRFVARNVAPIPIWHFAAAPLASMAVIAATMLFLEPEPFAIRVAAAIGTWIVTMAIFRLLPRQELQFMKRLLKLGRGGQPEGS